MTQSLSVAAQTARDLGNEIVKILLLWKAIFAPLKALNLLAVLFSSQVSKDLFLEIQYLGSKVEVFERGEKLTQLL